MNQVEKDLGTKLDWVGVDHWNTENPHVHIILRGRADDAKDLVIARDYIAKACGRGRDLVTQELGPRTDRESVAAWTARSRPSAGRGSTVSLFGTRVGKAISISHRGPIGARRLPAAEGRPAPQARIPGCGSSARTGPMGRGGRGRDDATRARRARRCHQAHAPGAHGAGIEHAASYYVLAGESIGDPFIGRLLDRGLDDELKGTAYAVVDGIDGRIHHVKLPDLDAAGDSAAGRSSSCASSTTRRAGAGSRSRCALISTSTRR